MSRYKKRIDPKHVREERIAAGDKVEILRQWAYTVRRERIKKMRRVGPHKYREGSIWGGGPLGRGLERYTYYLKFNPMDLWFKTVLDLGCGPEELFARELAKSGIRAAVCSMSPDYYDEETLNYAKSFPDWQGWSVAGCAEAMPFENETFDYIFALHSLTAHTHNWFSVDMWIEVIRTLKPGGTIYAGPTLAYATSIDDPDSEEEEIQAWEKLAKQLEEHGMIVKWKPFEFPDATITITKPSIFTWLDQHIITPLKDFLSN